MQLAAILYCGTPSRVAFLQSEAVIRYARTAEAPCGCRLRRDQGRSAVARDLLLPVYGWFTEGFDTPDLKEAKTLLDELT